MALVAGKKQENVLNKFTSFNNIFTLGVLSPRDYNEPNNAYISLGEPDLIILRSGGSGQSKKVTTFYEDRLGKKLEYYIDNVRIDSIVAPNPATGVARATKIEFTVHEPYSIGMFLQALKIGANQAGFENYTEAPYLLSVDFKGYDQNTQSYTPLNSKRHFPLKLTKMRFEVNASGAVYEVEAIPYNDVALSDLASNITTDVNITGGNVAELTKSLEEVVNEVYFERALAAGISVPDKIEIRFDTLSDVNSTVRTTDFYDDAILRNLRRITVDSSQVDTTAPTGGSQGSIGDSTISLDILRGTGNVPFSSYVEVIQDDGIPYFSNGQTIISADGRDFQFSPVIDISTVLTEIILTSEYVKDKLNEVETAGDNAGLIDWFCIQVQTIINPNATALSINGNTPKIYVYRILPYKAHHSLFKKPDQAPVGVSDLAKSVVKEYNYIYTGKNDSILNFDIQLNYTFFQALAADAFSAGAADATSTSRGPNSTGSAVQQRGVPAGQVAPSSQTGATTSTSTGRASPGGLADQKERIARSIHDAIVDSDADLIKLNLEIMGDPYFLADSNMGNFVDSVVHPNLNSNGSIDTLQRESHIIINFRTPLDIDPITGVMIFPEQLLNVESFSGLYRVIKIRNKFNGNSFTQELELNRIKDQEGISTAELASGSTGGDIDSATTGPR